MTATQTHDIVTPVVRDYIDSLATETDPLVIRMARYAQHRSFPWLGHDSAIWLELLARSVGARRAFEFGSGFGYSAYFLARALGAQGEVHGSELDQELVSAHAELFGSHPYRERIHLHARDGLDALAALSGSFDLVFIDFDKPLYPQALRAAVERTRIGGLIIADNVLWGGQTAAADADCDDNARALRAYNRQAHSDARLKTAILPVGDGLSVSLRVA